MHSVSIIYMAIQPCRMSPSSFNTYTELLFRRTQHSDDFDCPPYISAHMCCTILPIIIIWGRNNVMISNGGQFCGDGN